MKAFKGKSDRVLTMMLNKIKVQISRLGREQHTPKNKRDRAMSEIQTDLKSKWAAYTAIDKELVRRGHKPDSPLGYAKEDQKLPDIQRLMPGRGHDTWRHESAMATAAELVTAIETTIRKHFPKSSVRVVFQPGLKPSILIVFTVAGGKDEVPAGIMHNDLSYTLVHIWGMDKEGNLGPTLQFDPSQGGSILVKPPENSHLAFGNVKVGLRKKKGTPAQVLKHIDTYFTKLLKALKANKSDLPERQVRKLKSVRL